MSISVQSNLATNLPLPNMTSGSDAQDRTNAAGSEGAPPAPSSAATNPAVTTRQLSAHMDLVSIVNQSQQTGVGQLVNSTLETDTAKLQALNVQQQLAGQPLSIANGTPQLILQLFKG